MRRVRRWWARRQALARRGEAIPRWAWQAVASVFLFAALFGAQRLPYPWARAVPQGVRVVLTRDDTAAWIDAARALPALGQTLAGSGALVTAPSSESRAPAGALPTGLGRLRWPLAGAVVSAFGFRGGGANPEYHTGLDIAGLAGGEVRAIADGRVSAVGRSPSGSGYEVVIIHAFGWSSAYGHLLAPDVTPGQDVRGGDLLGRLAAGGDDGHQTGAILHFELRQGGRPLDPAPYLGLLPGSGT